MSESLFLVIVIDVASISYSCINKDNLNISRSYHYLFFFFFQAEDGIRDLTVTGVQTCALPISQIRQAEVGRRHADDQQLVLGALQPDHAKCEHEDGKPAEDHDQPAAHRWPGPDRRRASATECDVLLRHRRAAPTAGS